jgi:hypothetical protein
MPAGLKRYYGLGHLHFITFSCYRRLPLLKTVRATRTTTPRTRFKRRVWGTLRVVPARERKEVCSFDRQE